MEVVQFYGDSPLARFGHNIIPINRDRAILFGGAVGEGGKYVITGDTYLCDLIQKKWKKLENQGEFPSNRAAHGSIVIEHLFFVYGGALGGGELADGHLYQLDLRHIVDQAVWSIKKCDGPSPGARYGHVIAYLKPYLIIYGGNTGSQVVGDIWKIDILGNCVWEKVNTGDQNPPPRVYHSASICRTGTAGGMMVIFGGRGNGVQPLPLNDAWGLRKHRDGRLDWMKAPYRSNFKPAERYQHRSIFVGTLLLIIGGRNNDVGKAMPLDIYDTDSSEWYRLPSVERFRHCCFMLDSLIYVHGGFSQNTPNVPTDQTLCLDLNKIFEAHPPLFRGLAFELGRDIFTSTRQPSSQNRLRSEDEHIKNSRSSERIVMSQQTKRVQKMEIENPMKRSLHSSKAIRLFHEAIVANFNEDPDVQKVQIDLLPNEHKRLVGNPTLQSAKQNLEKVERITKFFLISLFCRPVAQISYPIPNDYIDKLLSGVEKIVEEEPTLLRMRLPTKIFGDIHGQVNELNRFFDAFGSPSDQSSIGDIDSTNYLFLGDYIDRGCKSVETLLLLFALKLKFPENVVLLRGGHEDRTINRSMGFGDECALKFKENIDDPFSFYNRCNKIFDKLPLAALIDDSLLCMHGGIGQSVKTLKDIQRIERPLRIVHDPKSKQEKVVIDLLWSDPCRTNQPESTLNIDHDYFRNKQNFKFSEDHAANFCLQNELSAIIRGGQPLSEGYDLKESIVSVFSCSDYGGCGNKAGMIHAMKNEQLVPKILGAVSGKERWLSIQEGSRLISGDDVNLRKLRFTPPKMKK